MLSLLTVMFVPFFLLTWIMGVSPDYPSCCHNHANCQILRSVNVASSAFPIEILPIFYRYGYAMPFYNFSKAARIIVFGTKNRRE